MTRPLSRRRFFALWGIVYHHGRRSGRPLATPVAVRRTPDGFVIALPFEGAQWYRNVLASGGCVLRWKGADHQTERPQIVDWSTARRWFNPVQRAILDLTGVDSYLRLTAVSPSPDRQSASGD
jgi:deazaflavin-dependent oxidoreductase (nitroreductase family)